MLGCADVARAAGADQLGTASRIRSWLLVEHPGPWPEDVQEQLLREALPAHAYEEVLRLWDDEWLRPLVIRRPGRTGRQPRTRRTVILGAAAPEPWLEQLELTDLRELAELDLPALAAGEPGHGDPLPGPLFAACTHGTVDACCAVRGRAVVGALADRHPEETWEVSHLGGCRFAANLLVLPAGTLHGTLDPADALEVAAAARRGLVTPLGLRGRLGTETLAGAAEVVVRRRTGTVAAEAVRAVAVREHPDTYLDEEEGELPAGADVEVAVAQEGRASRLLVRLRQRQREPRPSRCDPDGTHLSDLVVTHLEALPATPRRDPWP